MPATEPTPYATVDELRNALGDAAPENAGRLLREASDLIDEYVVRSFAADASTGLPTDVEVARTMRDAVCAQIEFWLTTGEEHDVEGSGHKKVRVGGLSTTLPPTLAPRALRKLRNGGMMADLRRDSWTEFVSSGN